MTTDHLALIATILASIISLRTAVRFAKSNPHVFCALCLFCLSWAVLIGYYIPDSVVSSEWPPKLVRESGKGVEAPWIIEGYNGMMPCFVLVEKPSTNEIESYNGLVESKRREIKDAREEMLMRKELLPAYGGFLFCCVGALLAAQARKKHPSDLRGRIDAGVNLILTFALVILSTHGLCFAGIKRMDGWADVLGLQSSQVTPLIGTALDVFGYFSIGAGCHYLFERRFSIPIWLIMLIYSISEVAFFKINVLQNQPMNDIFKIAFAILKLIFASLFCYRLAKSEMSKDELRAPVLNYLNGLAFRTPRKVAR